MKSILGNNKVADVIFFFEPTSSQTEKVSIFVRITEASDSETALVFPVPGELKSVSNIDLDDGKRKMKEFYDHTVTLRRYSGRTSPYNYSDEMFRDIPKNSEFRLSNVNGIGKFTAKTFNSYSYNGDVCGEHRTTGDQYLNVYMPNTQVGIYGFTYIAINSVDTPQTFQIISSPTINTYYLTYDYSHITQNHIIIPALTGAGYSYDSLNYSGEPTETHLHKLKKEDSSAVALKVTWNSASYNMVMFYGKTDTKMAVNI